MGSGAMMLGHSHPDVVAAIREHIEDGTFFATVHPLEIAWAELIQQLVPSAERVRFVASGTEATLLALRVARAYSRKEKVLRFEGHFHGWHDYLALGSKAPFDGFPSEGIPDVIRDTVVVCPTDAQRVEEFLRNDSRIGTIICEVSGANWGSVPLGDEFLRDLRKLADKYGCVLIFDEVITGFRWSPGGKQALIGVIPDLTTMAKIVAGGLPGGAVGGRAEIMGLLDPTAGKKPTVMHKGTFNGSPLVAAAAVAALNVIKTGKPHKHADAVAEKLRSGMQRVLDELQVDGRVYGEASSFHVYFAKGARTCAIESLTPKEIRSISRDALDVYTMGLRKRGVDFMSYTGGVTSLAHSELDVPPTLEAFQGAASDLLGAGLIPRI